MNQMVYHGIICMVFDELLNLVCMIYQSIGICSTGKLANLLRLLLIVAVVGPMSESSQRIINVFIHGIPVCICDIQYACVCNGAWKLVSCLPAHALTEVVFMVRLFFLPSAGQDDACTCHRQHPCLHR